MNLRLLSENSCEVLAALRAHVENDNGDGFGQVYLDNAFADVAFLSPHQFAGCLSSLERKGLYKPQGDDCFGDVKLED